MDAKYRFVTEDLTAQEFIAQFGKERLASSLSNFKSIGDSEQYWLPGGKIRIAEYFYIEEEPDTVLTLSDGREVLFSKLDTLFPDTKGQLPPGIAVTLSREASIPVVHWALITGLDILKERIWKGRYIPLIPIIGKQVQLDGNRILHGMVRYAREPQRLYNYMYSTLVETVALAPRNQFIAAAGQIDEFRDAWERANTDPQATLVYTPIFAIGPNGEAVLLPPPVRQSAAVDIAAFVQGLQVADQQMKAVFSIYDASLGQRGPQESGLAINARKIESDTGTYNWGDNFIRALEALWRVVDDLLPFYYNTPGRVAQIIREDNTQESVTLNQLYKDRDGIDRLWNLENGRYGIVISTGPSFQTRRQEAASSMLEIVKAYPPLMQIAGPMIIREQDWPGADAIASQMENAMPPELRPQDKNAPPIPPEFQNQMAQAMAQIQALTQALHAATDKNETQRMKEEFNLLRTEMTNTSNQIIALINTKSSEAQFLNEKQFQEAERLRAKLEPPEEPGNASKTPQGSAS